MSPGSESPGSKTCPPRPKKLQSGWFEGITLSPSCNKRPQCWGPHRLYFTSRVKRGRRAVVSLGPGPPSPVNLEVLGQTSGPSSAPGRCPGSRCRRPSSSSQEKGPVLVVIDVTEGQSRLPRVRSSWGRGSWEPAGAEGAAASSTHSLCLQRSSHLHLLSIPSQSGAKVKHFFP